MSTFKKEHLLLLFEHPLEPVFFRKGKGNKTFTFQVSKERLPAEFGALDLEDFNKFAIGTEVISIKETPPVILGEITNLGRQEMFSKFLPFHRKIADDLISIFLKAKDCEELLSIAAQVRDHVNPSLFNYALSIALTHRDDTKDLTPPSLIFPFPEKFVRPDILQKLRVLGNVLSHGKRQPVEIPWEFTATDLDEEHRVAYFREDFGVNIHHWHWHLVYPDSASEYNNRLIVDKDRRGELFFYMHQQLIARYNFERFSNNLKRVESFDAWKFPIKEAYFSKLNSTVASMNYGTRSKDQKLGNLYRAQDKISIELANMEKWLRRILNAIHEKKVILENGDVVELTDEKGIDILGNMVEASDLSPNKRFYGNLHNFGHVFIACAHDPDNRYLEPMGVMGELSTAMRDPMFYRWHRLIDDIFQEYKSTLPCYTDSQLTFTDVFVQHVEVQCQAEKKSNVLKTFWKKADVDLSGGMDFMRIGGPLYVRFTHLQLNPFVYKITVENKSQQKKKGTCRIFLAPKFNEINQSWNLDEQRTMFIELDKFVVNLEHGINKVYRKSSESNVTIPFDRIFGDYSYDEPQKDFCGCGWPEYLLIPKGTEKGLLCQLFVMISDFDGDNVDPLSKEDCADGGSYCGIRDKKYPDKRPMGYPFDRNPSQKLQSLQEFLKPNMKVADIEIIHKNVVKEPKDDTPVD